MIDQETKELLDKLRQRSEIVRSDAWQLVKTELSDKVKLLEDPYQINLDLSNEQIGAEVKSRVGAASNIKQVIQDIEEAAKSYEQTRKTLEPNNKAPFIITLQ